MGTFVETWADSNRWSLLNGVPFDVSGGHLLPAVGAQNPLLRFVQDVSPGIAVEMLLMPDDDLQLSLVKPSSSIDFANQGAITYFGVLYERSFGAYANQFVVNWRDSWDHAIQSVASGLIASMQTYRLLFTLSGGVANVRVYSALDALLFSFTQSDVLLGDMTFLVNPGRAASDLTRPWIGRSTFLWGVSQATIDSILSAGTIVLPSLSIPSMPTQPAFVEGVYSTWSTPSFAGTGVLSVTPQTSLPPGLAIAAQGDSLIVFGAAAVGSAGIYPITLLVTDGVTTQSVTVYLTLTVQPSWMQETNVVTADMLELGDYYYRLAGGPLRKEFRHGL